MSRRTEELYKLCSEVYERTGWKPIERSIKETLEFEMTCQEVK